MSKVSKVSKKKKIPTKVGSFNDIRKLSDEERRAACLNRVVSGSLSGCYVARKTYNKCYECPLNTAADMHPKVCALWYKNMVKIGYFKGGKKHEQNHP